MIKDQEVTFYKRYIYGYFPMFILFLFGLLGVVTASSNYLNYKALSRMEKWSCEGKVSSPESWEISYHALIQASSLSPMDADTQLYLGDLFDWKANASEFWSESAQDTRLVAIKYYRKAIQLRPSWGAAWLKLTQSRLLNREVNDVTFQDLENSFRYGKRKPELKYKLIWIALGIWPSLTEPLKEQTRDLVKEQINDKSQFRKIIMLAIRYRWMDELNALLTDAEQKRFLELVKKNPKIISDEVRSMFGNEKRLVCS